MSKILGPNFWKGKELLQGKFLQPVSGHSFESLICTKLGTIVPGHKKKFFHPWEVQTRTPLGRIPKLIFSISDSLDRAVKIIKKINQSFKQIWWCATSVPVFVMIDQKRACLERTLLVIFDFVITWLAPENNESHMLHGTCPVTPISWPHSQDQFREKSYVEPTDSVQLICLLSKAKYEFMGFFN